jgi:curli production assembly/transport component CsgG/holdfast attachment protein HfaB
MSAFKKISGLMRAASVLALAGALSACVSPNAGKDGLYASPIGNAPVTANPTPYSQALVCIGEHARSRQLTGPRVAVGRILDYTGKVDVEGGRRITQGASLMAITAFAKSGARLVERFDTSVSELELRYANNRLISDENQTPVRPILAGQVPGSDYYLVGGITELNYNIRSGGIDASIGDVTPSDPKFSFSGKQFVMNVGLDLRLVSTKTLEVVDVVSYQKQIIGREVRAGVFAFSNDNVFDVGAGERALEPIQMAVRAGVERAVVEMMSNLYGIEDSSVCADALKAGGDPMGNGNVSGNYRPAQGSNVAAQSARRVNQDSWHEGRDAVLRGRINPPAPESDTKPATRPANSPVVAGVTAPATSTPVAAETKSTPSRTASARPTSQRGGPAILVSAPVLRGASKE